MTRRAREIETLFLSMFAALPLYFTYVISFASLIVFHLFMAGIVLRVALGKSPELLPARLMRWVAIAYVPFYVLDAAVLSRSAIAASTHLVLFIAAYQPIEAVHRTNQAQRLLTAALIFIASLATSTHITIVLFVLAFAYLMFRQLMDVSHLETVRSVGRQYAEAPTGRPAAFYLGGAILIGALLFPMLPRLRNPLVRGFLSPLPGSSTALSETINLNEQRNTPADTTVVARVWMDRDTQSFFTPVRLRGTIYDRYVRGEWQQSLRGLREVLPEDGTFTIARPQGVRRGATVQLRPQKGKLFLPVGTYAITGVNNLYEGPTREAYHSYQDGALNLSVQMAFKAEPLRLARLSMSGYPISPAVETLAHSVVGNETRPERQAALIEQYMVRNFRYMASPATGTPITLEQFLLRDRAGHCEYFAAGMVALMNALGVPARIAGGFYGGRANPLTGYYAIRREDAHAWTEVWDGTRWVTFDATPPSLRPGATEANPIRLYLAAISDWLTFFWDRYVLTFGLTDQIDLFTDGMEWVRGQWASLRGQLSVAARNLLTPRFGTLVAVLIVASGLMVYLTRRRRLFDRLAAYLAAQGIEVGPSMTMEDALRLLRAENPEAARELEPLVALYEEEEFSATRDPERKRTLKRMLAELRT